MITTAVFPKKPVQRQMDGNLHRLFSSHFHLLAQVPMGVYLGNGGKNFRIWYHRRFKSLPQMRLTVEPYPMFRFWIALVPAWQIRKACFSSRSSKDLAVVKMEAESKLGEWTIQPPFSEMFRLPSAKLLGLSGQYTAFHSCTEYCRQHLIAALLGMPL